PGPLFAPAGGPPPPPPTPAAPPTRAAPRINPGPRRTNGIFGPPSSSRVRLGPLAGGYDDLVRDSVVVVELAPRFSDRVRHRLPPDVLPDQQRGRGVWVEHLSGRHQV